MMDRDEKQYEGIPYFKTVGRILRFSAKCAPWEILFCAGIYLAMGLLPVAVVYVWNHLLKRLTAFVDYSGAVVLHPVSNNTLLGWKNLLYSIKNGIGGRRYATLHCHADKR